MKKFWIKLYVELLDDPKIGPLQAWLKWRFVELLLVAAESDECGMLPSVTRLAWRLRVNEDDLLKSLCALRESGVVCEQGDRWKVTNFEKRQEALSHAERQALYRDRHGDEKSLSSHENSDEAGVTDSSSTSSSDSSSVSISKDRGVGEGEVFKAFEANIGQLTPLIADGLKADIDEYTSEWVLTAIEQAAKMNKRSLKYVEGTLRGWRKDGLVKPSAGKNPKPKRSAEEKIKRFMEGV